MIAMSFACSQTDPATEPAGVARLWRATLMPGRGNDYDLFASEESLPMFRSHGGYRGVTMMRNEEECCVVTYWSDMEAVQQLEMSSRYAATVVAIKAASVLREFGETVIMATHLTDFEEPGIVCGLGDSNP